MMDIPAVLTAAFPPADGILLDLMRRQIDDAMLTEIAKADYGKMADEMLAELRPIRDVGVIPSPMHWQLVEVLSLTRLCDPEVPDDPPFESGPTGRRGHQIRLFACAVLLRAAAEPANVDIDNDDDSTLAQCLASAKVLGPEAGKAAARFLTWRIPRMEFCSEPPLWPLALLILATRLRSGRIAERDLGDVAEWVLAVEALWRQAVGPHDPSNPMPVAFSLQAGFWRPLATELKDEGTAILADHVRANIQLCELLLEPGAPR
jgi:hypothetical protein